ncbi:MAG: DUF192 domain-containing protein [Bacteriovoracaceae bacterium]|nr:DUF192 domain-containing protein [Bacteriovoracaceae bacterium]
MNYVLKNIQHPHKLYPIRKADTFFARLVGLMGQKKTSTGLLLEPCQSIHTCFMLFPLDVIFLDANNRVVKVIYHLKPWRFTLFYFKAKKVVEFPIGIIPAHIKEKEEWEVECLS